MCLRSGLQERITINWLYDLFQNTYELLFGMTEIMGLMDTIAFKVNLICHPLLIVVITKHDFFSQKLVLFFY